MRCQDAAAAVTNLREGGLSPWGTFRVQRHLALCPACRDYATQLEAAASAAQLLAIEPLDPAHEAQTMSAFRAWQKRRSHLPAEGRARVLAAPGHGRIIAALVLASLAGIALSPYRPPFGFAWIAAFVLTLLACAMVPLTRKRGLIVVAVAIASAALPLLVTQRVALTWLPHLPCVMHELGAAALAVAALWIWHKDRASRSPSSAAGIAALGALAGDAALHVACSASNQLWHVLVFHVGGIAVSAALAAVAAARFVTPRGALS
jgi:hypothetical protein